jgi:ribosome recycling factor
MATTDLGDFDFGFSPVSEDELKSLERELQVQVKEYHAALQEAAKTYEDKLNTLYKMVLPLLKNLAKDSDKDYIYWPDRQKKMTDFIKKIDQLMTSV